MYSYTRHKPQLTTSGSRHSPRVSRRINRDVQVKQARRRSLATNHIESSLPISNIGYETRKGSESKFDDKSQDARPAQNEVLTQSGRRSGHESPLSEFISSRSQIVKGVPVPAGRLRVAERLYGTNLGETRLFHDASTAQTLGTCAFTIGSDIVLDPRRVSLNTVQGFYILMHELAHVAQQHSSNVKSFDIGHKNTNQGPEFEANRAAGNALYGIPTRVAVGSRPTEIARFDDDLHRVIEFLALEGVFPQNEIEKIYQGNLERDYSQIPFGEFFNFLLIGKSGAFGGYDPKEHFDNYVYDPKQGAWFSRLDPFRSIHETRGPLDYIKQELRASLKSISTSERFRRLGNALHTIEDFFAHSNFVELTMLGPDVSSVLLTGSFSDRDSVISITNKLYKYTGSDWYKNYAMALQQGVSTTSHSLMAKDSADHPLCRQAMILAIGLVKEVIWRMDIAYIIHPVNEKGAYDEIDDIMSILIRRLAPPDWSDPWWQSLEPGVNPEIEGKLEKLLERTDPAVNQTVVSPLGALRAMADQAPVVPLLGLYGSRRLGKGIDIAGGMGLNLMIDPYIEANPDALRKLTPFLGPVLLIRWDGKPDSWD